MNPFGQIRQGFHHWKSWRQWSTLKDRKRAIVFYGESRASWPHLEPVITSLIIDCDEEVHYFASRNDDPGLAFRHENFRACPIGRGPIFTLAFQNLMAGVVVMTTPDLNQFHLRRSANVGHYAYIHHSMVSSHMIYRPGAFDHFDSIFCVGPHHVAETRASEREFNTPRKMLVEHGFGRLDALMQTGPSTVKVDDAGERTVLIAPSWGPNGLFETCGREVVSCLLNAGFRVIARPHPITTRTHHATIEDLGKTFGGSERFSLELDMIGTKSLEQADLMVSDWSGAAFEFAFAFEKPVIFLDLPPKINNPNFEAVGIAPIEVALRGFLGTALPFSQLSDLPTRIQEIQSDRFAIREKLAALRNEYVFNLGHSGQFAAKAIVDIRNDL